jgi:tripartite-type tricarboxylate transporter receptor subunit TctC
LAAAGRTRIESLPDVPTVAESGLKDYEVNLWYGLVAPAKTSKERIVQFVGWLTSALQDPGVRAKLIAVGFYPVGKCGADFAAHIRSQSEEYGRIIRLANINAQ